MPTNRSDVLILKVTQKVLVNQSRLKMFFRNFTFCVLTIIYSPEKKKMQTIRDVNGQTALESGRQKEAFIKLYHNWTSKVVCDENKTLKAKQKC